MQQNPLVPSTQTTDSDTPIDSIGRHLRWQIVLVLIGVLLLATLLGYSTYNMATTLVPERGGTFREGVAGNPRFVNPLLCHASDIDKDLCVLIYRGLTKIDTNGLVIPDLAAEWTVVEDRIYTFRLKENQQWHDGQLVDADDVLFTVNIFKDPNVFNLPDLTQLWRTVEVEKIDQMTVRFSQSEPSPFLDYTTIGLLPEHIWGGVPATELASKPLDGIPIGTGPFKVTEIAADHIRFEPNPFDADSNAYITSLELKFYPDHPSLLSAYSEGEIDGISLITPTDLPEAASREDLNLFSTMLSSYVNILFNLENPNTPFFQEKAVRQALSYGLNRERMIEETIAGQGIVAHNLLLPGNWSYNPNITQYPYRPDLARQLLDQAGWIDTDGDAIRDKGGQPLRFILYTNDTPIHQSLSRQIAEDWQAIGVLAIPESVSFAGLVGNFLAPRTYEAAITSWELPGDPDPYPLWHSTRAGFGGQNYSGWSNEEADDMMEQARSITNLEERKALYWRFQEIFTDEVPALPLYYPVYTYGVSERVQNVQIGSINYPAERFTTFADWYIVTKRIPSNQVPTTAPIPSPSSQ